MSDDRADRLSSKRSESRKKVREAAEDAEKDDDGESSQTMKDERREKMFYLDPDQFKELDHVYNKLKTDFEYEYDQTFMKNRHYYPLVVKYGLDSLEGLDASEVHNLLTDLDILEA